MIFSDHLLNSIYQGCEHCDFSTFRTDSVQHITVIDFWIVCNFPLDSNIPDVSSSLNHAYFVHADFNSPSRYVKMK